MGINLRCIDTQSTKNMRVSSWEGLVEYRPDTTTHTNRTSFGFEGNMHATEGRDFSSPSTYEGVYYLGAVFYHTITLQSFVYGFR